MAAQKKLAVREHDLGRILAVSPKKAIKCLVKGLGQPVKKGELVASRKGLVRRKDFFAPHDGVLDSLTEKGVLRIRALPKKKAKTSSPLSLPKGTREIKGTWGKGERVFGRLFCLKKEGTIFDLNDEYRGQILALFGRLNRGFWHKAKALGIGGIICGALPEEKFTDQIEKEVLVVDGKGREIACPLVVLDGKGEISQENWRILETSQGKEIFLEGDYHRVLIPSDDRPPLA